MSISQRSTPRLGGVEISLQVCITRGRTCDLNAVLSHSEVHDLLLQVLSFFSKKHSLFVGGMSGLGLLITYSVHTGESIFPGQQQSGLEGEVARSFGLKSHMGLKHT